MKRDLKFLKAVFLQIGAVVGAGIFGLPFVVAESGLLMGLFFLLFLSLVNLSINYLYTEVVMRTEGDHQLTGYGRLYLGRGGLIVATLALMTAGYGSMLAYITQIGNFLSLIFNLPMTEIWFGVLSLVFVGLFVFWGLDRVSQIQFFLVPGVICLTLFVAFLCFFQFSWSNFSLTSSDLVSIFRPYGVFLFALSGSSVIPEVEEVLRQDHSKLRRAVFWGGSIPILIYLVFILAVVGVSGVQTSQDAISGLQGYLPDSLVYAGAVLGVLTMLTSFLSLGYVVKEMFFRDFGFSREVSWLGVFLPPLVLFLSGIRGFVSILEFSGGIMGGLTGLLIVRLFKVSGSTELKGVGSPGIHFPVAILWLIQLVFIGGIFYQILPSVWSFFS